MSDAKKAGRPRKWAYKGEKKQTQIRLSEDEKKKILKKFNSIQEFIQFSIEKIKNT